MRVKFKRFDRRDLPDPADYFGANIQKLGRPNGEGWALGLCPFHDDHRPSLSLNMKSGGYKCFSCGASGGGIIDFHMRLYGLDFKEAVNEIGGVI